MTQTKCRCHSSDLYAGLVKCPGCGHNSFDTIAQSCERRKCGFDLYFEDDFLRYFQGRTDVFAEQMSDGSYRPIERAITTKDVADHLAMEATYGIYTVDLHNRTHLLCFDIDTGLAADAERITDTLDLFITADQYIVEHSGRKGYHVWVFLDRWVDAGVAFRAARAILQMAKMQGTEAYPKQPKVENGKGYGNLIKLPLGKHKLGSFSNWLNLDDELTQIQPIDLATLEAIASEYSEPVVVSLSTVTAEQRAAYPLPPCMRRVQQDGVGKGMRDHALYSMALELRAKDVPEIEAFDLLMDANSRFDPPMPEHEVRKAYQPAYAGPPGGSGLRCSEPHLHDKRNLLCSQRCPRYKHIEGMPATEDEPEGGVREGGAQAFEVGQTLSFEIVKRKSIGDGRILLMLENERIPDLLRVELEAD